MTRLISHDVDGARHPAREQLQRLLCPSGARLLGEAPRGPREASISWLLHLLGDVDSNMVLDDAPKEFSELKPPPMLLLLLLRGPEFGVSSPDVQARMRARLNRKVASAPTPEAVP